MLRSPKSKTSTTLKHSINNRYKLNPAFGMSNVMTPQNLLNTHNFENIILFTLIFQLLSYIFKGL